LLWTRESESKGESDLLWTPESNGLQIQIQNQMDSVRSLVIGYVGSGSYESPISPLVKMASTDCQCLCTLKLESVDCFRTGMP
jgi:hypothetical protein